MTSETQTPANSDEPPATSRGGAPKGNHNRTVHGGRSRRELPLAELGNTNAKRARDRWHDAATAALRDISGGSLSFAKTEMLRDAARYEATALLAEYRRRQKGLTFDQVASLDSTIATAIAAKGRILARLGLVPDAVASAPADPLAAALAQFDQEPAPKEQPAGPIPAAGPAAPGTRVGTSPGASFTPGVTPLNVGGEADRQLAPVRGLAERTGGNGFSSNGGTADV
jgi:hypothetical protein